MTAGTFPTGTTQHRALHRLFKDDKISISADGSAPLSLPATLHLVDGGHFHFTTLYYTLLHAAPGRRRALPLRAQGRRPLFYIWLGLICF